LVKSDKTYSDWMPLPNHIGLTIQLDKNKCVHYKQEKKIYLLLHETLKVI